MLGLIFTSASNPLLVFDGHENSVPWSCDCRAHKGADGTPENYGDETSSIKKTQVVKETKTIAFWVDVVHGASVAPAKHYWKDQQLLKNHESYH